MSGPRFGDFLTGLLIGGAVGYAIALLNAPAPGDETRQMLTERGRVLRDQAMDTMQTTLDKTGKLVADSRDRLNTTFDETKNRVQERVSDLKEQGGSVVVDARSKVSENLHNVADTVDPNAAPTRSDTYPEI